MNSIPSFPCHKHEPYYIDQCDAWINDHFEQLGIYNPYGLPIRSEDIDDTQYIEFQHGLQGQLMAVTSSADCPISCRCEFCDLDEESDCLEDEESDILEVEEEADILEQENPCLSFIAECEREYDGR